MTPFALNQIPSIFFNQFDGFTYFQFHWITPNKGIELKASRENFLDIFQFKIEHLVISK